MESTSYKEHIQHTFDSYCKKVLKNEAINIQKQYKRQCKRELSFFNLSKQELSILAVNDEYLFEYHYFEVLDFEICIRNESLAKYLKDLSKEKQKIILMYYFLGMTDKEIAEKMNLVRRTVQYKRTIILKELKQRWDGKNIDGI